MVKPKNQKSVPTEERRTSLRLKKPAVAVVEKKRAPAKKGPKAKKTKQPENGNTTAEEPKAEATDAK